MDAITRLYEIAMSCTADNIAVSREDVLELVERVRKLEAELRPWRIPAPTLQKVKHDPRTME